MLFLLQNTETIKYRLGVRLNQARTENTHSIKSYLPNVDDTRKTSQRNATINSKIYKVAALRVIANT